MTAFETGEIIGKLIMLVFVFFLVKSFFRSKEQKAKDRMIPDIPK